MLLKPVTALALSAFISFVASTAVAAPATTSDGKALTSSVKTTHHPKKASKKKKPGLAYHSAEPKSSPKVAASTSRPLDMKKASEKTAVSSKKGAVAGGKEVYIGGPTKPSADSKGSVNPPSSKVAAGKLHAGQPPVVKSGREASHAKSVAKVDSESGNDEHPVPAAALTAFVYPTPIPVSKVAVSTKPACSHEPIEFMRGEEKETFTLSRCEGGLTPLADERVSVLVRPESAARPQSFEALAKVKGPQLAPGIRRIDPGLLARVQTVADHFGKPGSPVRVSIVSGYRPNSSGSYHATGQALDFHVEGVSNEALVDFCKTLEDTGCGYYPNSSFVHIDVRAPKTGHVAWIDASGPGESPRYVASWPPPPDPDMKVADKEDELLKIDSWLPPLPGGPTVLDERGAPAASMQTPMRMKDWE
jgi:hypothetical protein